MFLIYLRNSTFTLSIYMSFLLSIEPPRPVYLGKFGLCRGSGTKTNTKFQQQKNTQKIKYKIST